MKKEQGPVHEVCLADLEPNHFSSYLYRSFQISGQKLDCSSWKRLVPAVCTYLEKRGKPVENLSKALGEDNTERSGTSTVAAIKHVKALLDHAGIPQSSCIASISMWGFSFGTNGDNPYVLEAAAKLKGQPLPPSSNDIQSFSLPPTNVILYGPPGTGKTYSSMFEAVQLIDGKLPEDGDAIKERFNELLNQARIGFVTFHQSYSYEDFVEGIRPVMDSGDGGEVPRYECRNGMFKTMCAAARVKSTRSTASADIDPKKTQFWKMSLGNTLLAVEAQIYDDCIEGGYIAHGYGGRVNFAGCDSLVAIRQNLATAEGENPDALFPAQAVDRLKNQMKIGDVVVISDGNHRFRAVGQITGDYECRPDQEYAQTRKTKWLRVFDESQPRERLLKDKIFSQATIYRLKSGDLKLDVIEELLSPPKDGALQPYVLIIDEINRGNISKILGELITLLEPDKREGQPNQLTVTLPYSQERFSVPSNLHIVGTMNTADKSIALVDVALRRRFRFKELMPDFSICDGLTPDMNQVLSRMNQRISIRKDRDHQIGHSYFMQVSDTDSFNRVFRDSVIPLLQEYFYGDWDGLRYVIGEVESTSGKILLPILMQDGDMKWARNRWRWWYEGGGKVDVLDVLCSNYGLAQANHAQN